MVSPRNAILNFMEEKGLSVKEMSDFLTIEESLLQDFLDKKVKRLSDIDRARLVWLNIPWYDLFDYPEDISDTKKILYEFIAYCGIPTSMFEEFLIGNGDMDTLYHHLQTLDIPHTTEAYLKELPNIRKKSEKQLVPMAVHEILNCEPLMDSLRQTLSSPETVDENIEQLKANEKALKEQITDLKNQLKVSQETVTKCEKEIKDLKTDKHNLSTQITILKEKAVEKEEAVKSLTERTRFLENSLEQKKSDTEGLPLLVYGENTDLYPGEIKQLILDSLSEYANGHEYKKRRQDIIEDLLRVNGYDENFTQQVKNGVYDSLKNCLDKRTFSSLTMLGSVPVAQTSDAVHQKYLFGKDSRYPFVCATSSSDYRETQNISSDICKRYV